MVQTTLIILTRNEISGLKALIKKIPFEVVDEYFAVDYKSTDGTVEFFEKNGIPVVKQLTPGRGKAFLLATQKAKGTHLIFFSPDGNENPADIPEVINFLNDGYDLVIASRFLKQSRNEEDNQFFKFRKWANQIFSLLIRIIWGGRITDAINGYRGINKKALNKLKLNTTGFAIEFQMTIRALKSKMKIFEIPTIEGNRIGGQSTAHAIPTGFKFIGLFVKEILIGNRF